MTAVVGAAQDKDAKTLVPALPPVTLPDGTQLALQADHRADRRLPERRHRRDAADAGRPDSHGRRRDHRHLRRRSRSPPDGKLATGSGQVVAAVAALMAADASLEDGHDDQRLHRHRPHPRGPPAELTQARADECCSRGWSRRAVDAARLRAVGNGSVDPIADNIHHRGSQGQQPDRLGDQQARRGRAPTGSTGQPDAGQPDAGQPRHPPPAPAPNPLI